MFDALGLEEIAQKCFEEKKLFSPKSQDGRIHVEKPEEYFEVTFVSNTGILVQSQLFLEKGFMRFRNINTTNQWGRGFGRKMVEATEKLARKCNILDAYILTNDNREFWEHMGYNVFDQFSPLMDKVRGLEMNELPAYKNLKILTT